MSAPTHETQELLALRARVASLEAEVRRLTENTRVVRGLVSETPQAIYAKATDNRFVLTNKRHASFIGLTESEILGHSDRDLFGDAADPIDEVTARVMSTGAPESSEFDLVLDGKERSFLETIYRLHDEDGAVLGIGGIATDITDRRALETELRVFKALADQTPFGVVIVGFRDDATAEPRYVNHAFWSLFGEGERARELAIDALHRVSDDVRRNLGGAAVWQGEARLEHVEGEAFPAVVSAFRLIHENAGSDALVLGIRDITDEKRHLRERERMAGLVAARDAAEASSRMKSEFLARMSHEIRTPMAAVIGYADLILHADGGGVDMLKHAASIRRNAEHLVGLLDDILDVSRIEADKIRFVMSRFDPRKMIHDVELLVRPLATERKLDLRLDLPDLLPRAITSDPLRLQQVLVNLAGNAIKFTDVGSVVLRVRMADANDTRAWLRVDVIDTGIGIEPHRIGDLFTAFAQPADPRLLRGRSSGLGLAISSRLITELGGRIAVESDLGRGSTFTIYIPVRATEASDLVVDMHAVVPAPAQTTEASPAAARQRVLVVEDSLDLRLLLESHMTKLGAEVHTACNGLEGVDQVFAAEQAGTPFDVVLLDMQMPVMDGYTAVQEIRKRGSSVYVVAITAYAMASDAERCLDLGCDLHLAKPFGFAHLRKILADRPVGHTRT